MAEPVASVKTPAPVTPSSEVDTITEEVFQHMIAQGRLAAAYARWDAEQKAAQAAAKAVEGAMPGEQKAMETAIQGKMNPKPFLEPPK